MRLVTAGWMTASCLGLLAGCDGISFQTARQAANGNDAAANGPVLLEMDPNLMNQPLNRDVAGSVLPQPGMDKPIGPAPDVRGIERLPSRKPKLAVIGRRIMPWPIQRVELDVLSQSGAGTVSPLARQALTVENGVRVSSNPISIAQELINLAQMGLRTAWR